jgi:ABC-type nitrate/sulfonate/bicarbonate transport system substrate-binding protein
MRLAPLLLLGTTLFLAHCPLRGADALQPLSFYPDWFPGAQFAGVYVALDRGYYRAAGLDVTLVPFAYGQKTSALIDAAPTTCGVATSEGYIFLQKRAAGADLKALGAVLQHAPAGFMSLRASGVTSARDFAGKTIGIHAFSDPLYRWFLRRAGVAESAATMRFVGDDLTPLLRGELAVMQGFSTEEFVKLRQLVGDEARFLSFADLGFESYSQLVYTTAPQLSLHSDALRRFIAATRRGWITALAEPPTALAAIKARLDPGAYDEAFQRACLTALRATVAPGGQSPLAPLDRSKLDRLEAVCVEIGLIKVAEPVANFAVDLELP